MILILSGFYYHLGLHCSQTIERRGQIRRPFYYHLGLHYSQTPVGILSGSVKFYYHLGLHYSQTQISKRQVFRSEKWENSPFSYGLEQHSDTTTEYPAAAKRL